MSDSSILAEIPQKHSVVEDMQGLTSGVFACAIGLVFLSHLGFLTGQTAGLALLLSYLFELPFGLTFFVVNLPFYWFTYLKLGWEFTIKSALCVLALSLMVDGLKSVILFDSLSPLVGVLAFGVVTGMGLLAIIRHQGSLGGMGALALVIQDTTGFKAGYVQQIADILIFGTALFFFPFEAVAWSIFGSIVLNGIIAFNHNRARYIAH